MCQHARSERDRWTADQLDQLANALVPSGPELSPTALALQNFRRAVSDRRPGAAVSLLGERQPRWPRCTGGLWPTPEVHLVRSEARRVGPGGGLTCSGCWWVRSVVGGRCR